MSVIAVEQPLRQPRPAARCSRSATRPSSRARPTGVITAAVPQPNISRRSPRRCAEMISSMPMGRSLTRKPHSRSSVMIESRVTPLRIVPSSGGVTNSSLMRTTMFMVPTSSRLAVLAGVGPQHLRVAALLRLLGGQQAGHVVRARLDAAQAAGRRARVLVLDPDARRGERLARVRADRRRDQEEQVALRRAHAQERLGRDQRRAQVQRRARSTTAPRRCRRAPAPGSPRASARCRWPACTGARAPSAMRRQWRSTRNSCTLPFAPRKALQPLEHGLAVVQHRRGRIQRAAPRTARRADRTTRRGRRRSRSTPCGR